MLLIDACAYSKYTSRVPFDLLIVFLAEDDTVVELAKLIFLLSLAFLYL